MVETEFAGGEISSLYNNKNAEKTEYVCGLYGHDESGICKVAFGRNLRKALSALQRIFWECDRRFLF